MILTQFILHAKDVVGSFNTYIDCSVHNKVYSFINNTKVFSLLSIKLSLPYYINCSKA